MPKIIQKSIYRAYKQSELWDELRRIDKKIANGDNNEVDKMREIIKEFRRRKIKIKVNSHLDQIIGGKNGRRKERRIKENIF